MNRAKELIQAGSSKSGMLPDDTIAAISTPMGEGGIGIVRISGPQAVNIAERIFSPSSGSVQAFSSHTIHYGVIIDPGTKEHVDEALLTIMRSPRTYTRQDVVEINCHGGVIPLKKILELCLDTGARLAEAGEFTRRAFLNGRIDLSQAEAVIDIIQAKTEAALKVSLKQLEGKLAREIRRFKDVLADVLAEIEAAIDFPEEELEIIDHSRIIQRTGTVNKEIEDLILSCAEGKFLREGILTVLAGKPNVGKSSLLNALLDEERAIVTPVPGTTRDSIEEYLNIGGFPVRLVDTAGLTEQSGRQAAGGGGNGAQAAPLEVGSRMVDLVEKEGIRRSRKKIEEADLVLAVFDGNSRRTQEDIQVMERLRDKMVIAVINKSDLPRKFPVEILKREWPGKPVISLSAIKREGIEKLKTAIIHLFSHTDFPLAERLVVTNVRHKNALVGAGKCLQQLIQSIKAGYSAEFLAVDLKESLDHLGELLGETTTEDILERIFSRFCIGK